MEKCDGANTHTITKFKNKKQVICSLLKEFYNLGWCTGSGGGISIRESENSILLAPSGVNKEYVEEEDIFECDVDGKILNPPKNQNLKLSECTPLFLTAYKLRNAGAVLHSHSINAVLITKLFENEFQCIDLEMIKGISGHKNTEWCVVPIIENTEFEKDLTESLKNAIIAYPRSHAVLVRNHGVYVWGPTWEKAKIHAESYEYLFKISLKMHKHAFKLPRTVSSDMEIKSWVIDETITTSTDLRHDLQHKIVQWVSAEYLKKIGVLRWKLNGLKDDSSLDVICKNYGNRDEVVISQQMENYAEKIKKFSTEHLHADEEVRYVLEGSGFFDVRDGHDKWVRIQVTKGDLLILPEGIYHRFVTDNSNFIHVMRLFKDEPKWTPIDRPCDEHPSRVKYLKDLLELNII